MTVNLHISSSQLNLEDIHDLSLEISRTIAQETDIETSLPEQVTEEGTKGELITVGTIVLAALTSGTVAALFSVLTAYFERDSSLEMEFERKDGQRLTIRAENVESEKIDDAMQLAREFFGESI